MGIASKLVSCQDQYRGIVENLLGRIVIVEDMDAAIAMARTYQNRFKIVTLDGQVVNPGGSMTGGSMNKDAGILSRANELEKLTARQRPCRTSWPHWRRICRRPSGGWTRWNTSVPPLPSSFVRLRIPC